MIPIEDLTDVTLAIEDTDGRIHLTQKIRKGTSTKLQSFEIFLDVEDR